MLIIDISIFNKGERLLNLAQLLSPARQRGFNVMESPKFQVVVEQAEADRAPLIVQVSPNEFAFFEREQYLYFTVHLHRNGNPFVLHYDHGKTFEGCVQAIQAGFTSDMKTILNDAVLASGFINLETIYGWLSQWFEIWQRRPMCLWLFCWTMDGTGTLLARQRKVIELCHAKGVRAK